MLPELKGTFTKEDKEKVIEFLNFITKRATFPEWKTEDTIQHFKLLNYMQQVILQKIEANVCDEPKIHEDAEIKEE